MAAESKNRMRKRRRYELAAARYRATAMERHLQNKYWFNKRQVTELEKVLKSLSEQYLEVCRQNHDLRQLPEALVQVPEGGIWLPSY